VHFVWATWDRLDLITPDLEPKIYASIVEACRENGSEVRAIGGVANHVHVLVRMHSMASSGWTAKLMKGASSHLVTHVLAPDQFFKWQATYGAFSVGLSELDRIVAYIENQKAHHARGEAIPELERCREQED
jgi:REP element-mobilizing transposase RayT